ncbi:MAG: aminotransferase class I/II-fold pyridoxal phosphate-dependent enzyme, partial [Anaerolineales bacterium]|nr:aminotransferase class I/II-fold pyridoxal phosphate-dependent enzyme [Anaerolineales bacterium]
MSYDFDRLIDRRASNSMKWRSYGEQVLPLWVADMDFPAPPPILAALQRALEHGIFGYDLPSPALRQTVARRMERLYGWEISPDWVIATPGIVSAFTVAAQAVCRSNEAILVQPPVYPPFLKVGEYTGLPQKVAPLRRLEQGQRLQYEIDWEALETAFQSDPPVGMFLLCSPHNPTGNVFSPTDLRRIAALCQEHDIFLCSDEIHSELLLGEAQHTPVAALLDPQAA